MKLLIRILRSVLFIYFSVAFLLYIFQRDFLYYPTPKINHEFEEQQFSIGDELLNVIVLNKGKEEAILYFGGNGESVVGNASTFNQIFSNYTVYLVNYRAYGGSTGKPTEAFLYSDAQYIYDAISTKHKKISVIGRSLGTEIFLCFVDIAS